MKPTPHHIIYPAVIEECIALLQPLVEEKLPKDKAYLTRWLCLKLMDGDEKILTSIEKNLNVSLREDSEIRLKLIQVKAKLSNQNIGGIDDFREEIVTNIVVEASKLTGTVRSLTRYHYRGRDEKIDRILTSKKFGIPIMLLFIGAIFWLTIVGANYPSQALSYVFGMLKDRLLWVFAHFHAPEWLTSSLIEGVYTTLTWVIAVMLPPMAIFFPLFTLLEDLGYLPRISFNLDNYFRKACSSGKQALTMCMGFGCNAAGVVGTRIIDSPREKLIAILTNSFVPCNGRFPFLITISSCFIGCYFTGVFSSLVSTLVVLAVVILGIILTLLISNLLSKTILKGIPSSFILELPPYRKPQIGKVLVRSLLDRTLFVLGRAISVAAPAGIVIWLFANITVGDLTLLTYIANFLEPFAKLMGLDGYILTAFIFNAKVYAASSIADKKLQSKTNDVVSITPDYANQKNKVLFANGELWNLDSNTNKLVNKEKGNIKKYV